MPRPENVDEPDLAIVGGPQSLDRMRQIESFGIEGARACRQLPAMRGVRDQPGGGLRQIGRLVRGDQDDGVARRPQRLGEASGCRHHRPPVRERDHHGRATSADAVRIRLQHDVARGHVPRQVGVRQWSRRVNAPGELRMAPHQIVAHRLAAPPEQQETAVCRRKKSRHAGRQQGTNQSAVGAQMADDRAASANPRSDFRGADRIVDDRNAADDRKPHDWRARHARATRAAFARPESRRTPAPPIDRRSRPFSE